MCDRTRRRRWTALIAWGAALGCSLWDSAAFAEPTAMRLEPHWKAEMARTIAIEHHRDFKVAGSDVAGQGSVSTRVKWKVESWGADGGLVSWTIAKVQVDGADATSLAARLAGLNQGLVLRVRIDRWGRAERLDNLEDVVAFYEKKTDRARAILDEMDVPDDASRPILQDMLRLKDVQTAEKAALTEVHTFLRPLELTLPAAGETEEFDAWIPSPVTHSLQPAPTSALEERVLASGEQMLVWVGKGKERTAAIRRKQTAKGQLVASTKNEKNQPFTWTESFDADVDAELGFPDKVDLERVLVVGDQTTTDRWEFRAR